MEENNINENNENIVNNDVNEGEVSAEVNSVENNAQQDNFAEIDEAYVMGDNSTAEQTSNSSDKVIYSAKLKAKQLRDIGWNALKGKYFKSIIATLIASFFGVVSFGGIGAGTNAIVDPQQITNYFNSMTEKDLIIFFVIAVGVLVLCIFLAILAPSIGLGYNLFFLGLYSDDRNPHLGTLFDRFDSKWRAIWMEIIMAVKVFLWTLLFVIPGIMASYRYSMARYVLAEHPELSANEAIEESKKIMKGQKWALFCFQISFIGWDILAGLVPVIGPILLMPYIQSATAAFYLNRTDRIVSSIQY